MKRCCMRAICSASGRGVLIKAGGGVSAGSGRFSVLSCSGSPLPVDDAEVVLAPTGVGGASPSAEVDGLSLSDRAAPALCTSAVGCPATTSECFQNGFHLQQNEMHQKLLFMAPCQPQQYSKVEV